MDAPSSQFKKENVKGQQELYVYDCIHSSQLLFSESTKEYEVCGCWRTKRTVKKFSLCWKKKNYRSRRQRVSEAINCLVQNGIGYNL